MVTESLLPTNFRAWWISNGYETSTLLFWLTLNMDVKLRVTHKEIYTSERIKNKMFDMFKALKCFSKLWALAENWLINLHQ